MSEESEMADAERTINKQYALLREVIASASVFVSNLAAIDVIDERWRQKTIEGWTAEHDDEHVSGEIARAAAAYALIDTNLPVVSAEGIALWPWDGKWWKPKSRRRNLVRAGALILAEIERLDRLAALDAAKGAA